MIGRVVVEVDNHVNYSIATRETRDAAFRAAGFDVIHILNSDVLENADAIA